MARSSGLRTYVLVMMLRKLIRDEAKRPGTDQYVKEHFYVPHGPFAMDANCIYREEVTFFEQSTCSLRLIVEFLVELKRLRRYRSSAIIVHFDHGLLPGCEGKEFKTMGRAMAEAIQQTSVRRAYGSGFTIDCMTQVLLMVKPPNSGEESLGVSMRQTQLLDIAATVYDMAGIPAQAPGGVSVLAPDYHRNPDIHIFAGYRQKDASGRYIFFGRDFKKGVMNHYVYRKGTGWKILQNLHGSW